MIECIAGKELFPVVRILGKESYMIAGYGLVECHVVAVSPSWIKAFYMRAIKYPILGNRDGVFYSSRSCYAEAR